MIREVAACSVLLHQSGSRDQRVLWQQIAGKLNAFYGFSVTARSVRNRRATILKKLSAQPN